MTRPALALVTGSRALAGNADARAWLRARLDVLAPAVVVTGDARGPDAWAAEWCSASRASAVVYRLDGRVVTPFGPPTLWTPEPPPARDAGRALWSAWCLHRDRVMVQHVARRADRYAVTVLALTSQASTTQGTAYTVARAKAAGLAVIAEVWS